MTSQESAAAIRRSTVIRKHRPGNDHNKPAATWPVGSMTFLAKSFRYDANFLRKKSMKLTKRKLLAKLYTLLAIISAAGVFFIAGFTADAKLLESQFAMVSVV